MVNSYYGHRNNPIYREKLRRRPPDRKAGVGRDSVIARRAELVRQAEVGLRTAKRQNKDSNLGI